MISSARADCEISASENNGGINKRVVGEDFKLQNTSATPYTDTQGLPHEIQVLTIGGHLVCSMYSKNEVGWCTCTYNLRFEVTGSYECRRTRVSVVSGCLRAGSLSQGVFA